MGGVVPRVGGDDEKDSSMAELPPSDLFGVEKPARINRGFFYHILGKFREIPKNLSPRVYQKKSLSIFFTFLGKLMKKKYKLKALHYLYYITYQLNFLMTLLRLKLNSILHSTS